MEKAAWCRTRPAWTCRRRAAPARLRGRLRARAPAHPDPGRGLRAHEARGRAATEVYVLRGPRARVLEAALPGAGAHIASPRTTSTTTRPRTTPSATRTARSSSSARTTRRRRWRGAWPNTTSARRPSIEPYRGRSALLHRERLPPARRRVRGAEVDREAILQHPVLGGSSRACTAPAPSWWRRWMARPRWRARPRSSTPFSRERIVKAGAKPAFLGYRGYPATLCISLNNEGGARDPVRQRSSRTAKREPQPRCIVDGFYGDAARTVGVGAIDADAQRLLKATGGVAARGRRSRSASQPSAVGDMGGPVRAWPRATGYWWCASPWGTALGTKSLHEDPQVPNYGPPGGTPRAAGRACAWPSSPWCNVGRPRCARPRQKRDSHDQIKAFRLSSQ